MTRLTDCIAMMDEGMGRIETAIPGTPRVEITLLRMLLMVGMRLQCELSHKLKPHKLNDSEFLVLACLLSRPDGSSTPGELCEHTAQGATNMTRIANALVKRGLVARAASREDRRRVVVRLTAAGRCLVQTLLPSIYTQVFPTFEGISSRDKQTMNRILRGLARNLDDLAAADV